MIVLDTNILIYAVGGDHPLRVPCQELMTQVGGRGRDAATTIDVIQEFAHVRSKRRSRQDTVALARRYASVLHLLETNPDDLRDALSLFEQVPALNAADAVLAAVALNRSAEALVSADRAFGAVPGLRWVDPLSSQFDALLAG